MLLPKHPLSNLSTVAAFLLVAKLRIISQTTKELLWTRFSVESEPSDEVQGLDNQ